MRYVGTFSDCKITFTYHLINGCLILFMNQERNLKQLVCNKYKDFHVLVLAGRHTLDVFPLVAVVSCLHRIPQQEVWPLSPQTPRPHVYDLYHLAEIQTTRDLIKPTLPLSNSNVYNKIQPFPRGNIIMP